MCECHIKVNEQIGGEKYNSILDFNLLSPNYTAIISTSKRVPKVRKGPVALFATYCPFCGVKYDHDK